MEPKDPFLLEQIIEFCDRIADTVKAKGGYEAFCEDLDYQDVCAFRALQIGELVRDLSDKFKQNHPEVAWGKIMGFRNIIAHDYGSVDLEIIWGILNKRIPELREICAKIIGQ